MLVVGHIACLPEEEGNREREGDRERRRRKRAKLLTSPKRRREEEEEEANARFALRLFGKGECSGYQIRRCMIFL